MTTFRLMLVTTFGLGFMRPASGTWGSMPPVGLVAIMLAAGASPLAVNAALLAILVVFSLSCLGLGDWAEARFGKKDSGCIVADETAGQCIPLLFLPAAAFGGATVVGSLSLRAVATLATAFVLFRIMDIVKPPPARGLQRLRAGLGVLIDDLFAGAYAAIIMQLVTRFLLPLAL